MKEYKVEDSHREWAKKHSTQHAIIEMLAWAYAQGQASTALLFDLASLGGHPVEVSESVREIVDTKKNPP